MMVFCKHCGKQITDDSLFCQYCGSKQDVKLSSASNSNEETEKLINNGFFSSISLSKRKKKYLILYTIWLLINIVLWLCGDNAIYQISSYYSHLTPKDRLFPFTLGNYYPSHLFNVDFYDGTDFIVYVIILPLILFYLFNYSHFTIDMKGKAKTKIENNKGNTK